MLHQIVNGDDMTSSIGLGTYRDLTQRHDLAPLHVNFQTTIQHKDVYSSFCNLCLCDLRACSSILHALCNTSAIREINHGL